MSQEPWESNKPCGPRLNWPSVRSDKLNQEFNLELRGLQFAWTWQVKNKPTAISK